ncbi:MAG TPA: sigma-54 dependent transcriptional regulator [Burkholderiaceae bacterium]|nr:sigma-54 dependent transcriptional regulator [Burkholderiaceae bacterium]
MSHALIVDDDNDAAEMLAELAVSQGFTAATARTMREAKRQLVMNAPDVMFLDLVLPDGKGTELFEDRSALGNTEVVLITGHASLETSIEALRLGAADYLIKPVTPSQVTSVLSRLMKPAELQAEITDLHQEMDRSGRFGEMWGTSASMRRVYEQISRVAGTAVTVLIEGESGTGKELVARSIHQLSRRRSRPFLAINCGAISPHLMESEIFGHEKGSFTGANRQHQGFFERAHGGTLFLDEITEMPLDLQVKLLRVLETGTFNRVGSTDTQTTDVRVIAATNRVPEEAVTRGKLREDLLYRLNVFPVRLPPLRDRPEDVQLLADHFLKEICEAEKQQKRFSPVAYSAMAAHDWPGNVRELRNVVQRAFVMSRDSIISDAWLELGASKASRNAELPLLAIRVGTSIAEAERALILATLDHFDGQKERTAAALGVSLKTLYNRLKEYAVDGGPQPRSNGTGHTEPAPLTPEA